VFDGITNFLDMFNNGDFALPYVETTGLVTTSLKKANIVSYLKHKYDENVEVSKAYYIRRTIKWSNIGIMQNTISRKRHVFHYGRVIDYSKDKNILMVDTSISAGVFPSFVTIDDDMDSIIATLTWDRPHIGPRRISFDPLHPYDNEHRSIGFERGETIYWTKMLDSRCDFYAFDFFKNDIDKLEFISRGYNHDIMQMLS